LIPPNPSVEKTPPKFPHLVLWFLFFFQFAAVAVYFTFLNVYFRQAGLSGTQIGLLNMLTALAGMLGAFVWGYLSDRTGKNRLLIALGAFGALALAQIIPYVHGFTAYLVLGCLGSLVGAAPATLVDSTTLALLGERRNDYGRYRLGGTFGYILTGSLVGFVFDRTGLQVMFPAYGVTMLLFAGVALLLPNLAISREPHPQGKISAMIRQPAWAMLMLCAFLIWIASNAAITFMGVVLKEMGATQGLISIAVTIGAVVEIPFMLYSPRLLRRFGPERLLLASMVLMVLRYVLIGFMPSPEWAVPINALNGPAYVFFWNSVVTLVNRMAPSGMAGTAQGLLSSTMSLASMVSALLTGWLFDLLGPTQLFFVMAVIVLAALVLFSAGLINIRRAASA
jgi:PPP family 3-phenylpropionic acid transporter